MSAVGSNRRSASGKIQSYQMRLRMLGDQTTLAAGATVAVVLPFNTFQGLPLYRGDTFQLQFNDSSVVRLYGTVHVLAEYDPDLPTSTPSLGMHVTNGSSTTYTFPDDGLDITIQATPFSPRLMLPAV